MDNVVADLRSYEPREMPIWARLKLIERGYSFSKVVRWQREDKDNILIIGQGICTVFLVGKNWRFK